MVAFNEKFCEGTKPQACRLISPILGSIVRLAVACCIVIAPISTKAEPNPGDDGNPEVLRELRTRYDRAYYFSDFGKYRVEKNGKEGFCDESGTEVLAPVYDDIITYMSSLYEGYVPVEKGGKKGLVDKNCKEVVPCVYDDLGLVSNEGSLIRIDVKKAGKKGVYDITEGKEVVPCIYDEVSNDGILKEIVPIAQGDLYGLYSISLQKEIVKCEYDNASFWDYYGCGFYYLKYDDESKPGPYYLVPVGREWLLYEYFQNVHGLVDGKLQRTVVVRDGKYGIMNRQYREILPCRYDFIKNPFGISRHENSMSNVVYNDADWDKVRFVIVHQGAKVRKNYEKNGEYYYKSEVIDGGLCGVYDLEADREVIPCKYTDFILQDVNGLFTFCEGGTLSGIGFNTAASGGKWGLIDVKGNILAEAKYDSPVLFSDGLAHVSEGGVHSVLRGTIDDAGNYVISADVAIQSDVDVNIPQCGKSADESFAFIIANENYQSAGASDFAINDGKVFKEYCTKVLGLPEKNIRYYEDATFGNMQSCLQRIKDIADAYESDASIIFYFAGLGMVDTDTACRYILPVDASLNHLSATGVSVNDMLNQLNGLSAKSVVAIFDAPFSGFDRKGDTMTKSRGVALKPSPIECNDNTVVCMSCATDGVSYSSADYSHGLFTYALLKHLKETKGECSLQDLMDYSSKWIKKTTVTNYGKVQSPMSLKSDKTDLSTIKF